MPLYVYITPECEQDMREHQAEETILSFKSRLLQEQRTTIFDRYPPPFLKKRFKRQERLIAAEISIDNSEDVLVVFLRMFVRGGRDYELFRKDPVAYGKDNFSDAISQQALCLWLNLNRESEKPLEKQNPTDEEQAFLWKILSQDHSLSSEEFIFESSDWLKAVEIKGLKNRLVNIPQHILECASATNEKYDILDAGSGIKILYRNFPGFKKLFLAGLFLDAAEAEISSLKNKYSFVLESSHVVEEDIIRASIRSYPGIIVLDADLWISIQQNQEANLALSPEESKLLQSVYEMSDASDGKKGFPLFINGRAGSGKSTILQYLFSDYLGFYIKENISTIAPPIYLTYSKDLVEKSRSCVTNLLTNNHKHKFLAPHSYRPEELSRMTSTCFVVFKNLLISLINNGDNEVIFDDTRYVDFRRFKTMWKQKFQGDPKAAEKYGPDISWHVIRTFIKGYSIGGYIDEEEYEDLPRDEKTVTKETFGLIFTKVWSNWYKNICNIDDPEKSNWDDQDVVRYIIDNELYSAEYPAIFCDEAQDFTRIELEFLFRSSIFSNRKITGQQLSRVPFVFAGDPFQTLNPTGFRWDSIKSAFVQKFIYALNAKQVYGSQLHYEELNFNYRSSREIVKLCNSLQTIRALHFNYKSLDPQKTWQLEDNPTIPVYFNSENPEVWERITEYPDLCIIVPCAEGEESHFVEADLYLQQFIQKDETGVPRNVISPLRSKGLEFDRVVVYGFGQYCQDKSFFDSVKSIAIDGADSRKEDLLSYEYYLNQLYVSISRARKTLIVIDSTPGLRFWDFAIDPDYISRSYHEMEVDFSNWEDSIGLLSKGTNDIWSGNVEDRQTTASRLENDGKDKQDPYILRQAAMVYKDLAKPLKEKQCKALACVFEHKYEKAGQLFLECNLPEEGVTNLWKAQNYAAIREIPDKYPNYAVDIRVRAAHQENRPLLSTSSVLFTELIKRYSETKDKILLFEDKTWTDCVTKIVSNVLLSENAATQEEWTRFGAIVELLNESGFIKKTNLIARVWMSAGEYENAIKVFEEIKELSSTDYQQAKNHIIKSKLKNLDISALSDSEKSLAAKLLVDEQRYIEAAKLFSDTGDTQSLIDLCSKIHSSSDESQFDKIFRFLIDTHLLKNQFWQVLCYFDPTPGAAVKSLLFYAKAFSQRDKWLVYITKEFSTSAQLPFTKNFELIRVSEFLRNYFSESNFAQWHMLIHPLVVGAAIERAGKDTDGARYYGSLEDSKEFDGLVSIESKKRLIAIKLRQSKREELNGQVAIAEKHKAEAEAKALELGIELKDISNYPFVNEYLLYPKGDKQKFREQELPFVSTESSLPISQEKVSQVLFVIFGIDVKVSRVNKKVMLTKNEDLSSFTLNLEKNMFTATDLTITEGANEFYLQEWNIRVVKLDGNRSIEVRFIAEAVEIRIDI